MFLAREGTFLRIVKIFEEHALGELTEKSLARIGRARRCGSWRFDAGHRRHKVKEDKELQDMKDRTRISPWKDERDDLAE